MGRHDWTYDVFLSFRGEDTRKGFTGNLYNALNQAGIRTFIDDEKLPRGEQITAALYKAIEESRIAITVLSKNYASSSFCLDELAMILKCCFKEKDRIVLPVFYGVDPADVRHQRGSYGEALASHEERFKDNKEKVHGWRMALTQVANLTGFHFKHGDVYEYKFIEDIVKEVFNKINRASQPVAKSESRVLKVNLLLNVGPDVGEGEHMVGIQGIGRIGKIGLDEARLLNPQEVPHTTTILPLPYQSSQPTEPPKALPSRPPHPALTWTQPEAQEESLAFPQTRKKKLEPKAASLTEEEGSNLERHMSNLKEAEHNWRQPSWSSVTDEFMNKLKNSNNARVKREIVLLSEGSRPLPRMPTPDPPLTSLHQQHQPKALSKKAEHNWLDSNWSSVTDEFMNKIKISDNARIKEERVVSTEGTRPTPRMPSSWFQ